jgi:hypothetical protein
MALLTGSRMNEMDVNGYAALSFDVGEIMVLAGLRSSPSLNDHFCTT